MATSGSTCPTSTSGVEAFVAAMAGVASSVSTQAQVAIDRKTD
jgi:hypothetical protein